MEGQLSELSEKKSTAEKQLVLFKLANEEFGVDILEVREIVRMESITKIPNTVGYIVGAINLRGSIITVMDLSMKLGLPLKPYDKNTRIIIIEVGNNTVGIIVDCATEVLHLHQDKVQPTPNILGSRTQSTIHTQFIDGIGTLNDRMIILLDLKKVVEEKDIA